jgi:hypothetical protein
MRRVDNTATFCLNKAQGFNVALTPETVDM